MIPSELLGLLPYLNEQERAELDRLLASEPWATRARPNQLPPPGNWRIWLLLAGRGFGKTRTIVEWAHAQAMAGPRRYGNIVASTSSDARDILVNGPSGFLSVCRPRPVYEPSKRLLSWPNGSTATLFSAEEPDRLRGPQCHWAIADELAAWKSTEAWDMLMFGLRLGQGPRVAVATTPRPTKLIRSLLHDPTAAVVRGSTYDNRANLAPEFFTDIITRYEGTRLGRQELNAEILDDAPGALWKAENVEPHRVSKVPEDGLQLVVVGVDPEATSNPDSAETGIVAVGKAGDGHYYVLADRSRRGTPSEWATNAIATYHAVEANYIVAEVNQGGDMVVATLKTIDPNVPVVIVRATRGKEVRAEPVVSLYQQGRVHHVGSFDQLEDQMYSWEPGVGRSPDRVDALVWAVTKLMEGPGTVEYAPDIW